ncbi:hypothetical protein [Acinetobacter sp.]|uniref:hypothetical protein n=1 Tax=Acinetobacter sp. TaxID=472 RepID=UPI0035AF4849
MFLIRQMRSGASQGKHLAAQCASPQNLSTFCTLKISIAKTVYLKDHRFALHCKQSSALFLLLRLALRIKAVLYFAASPCASNKSSALFCRFALRFE